MSRASSRGIDDVPEGGRVPREDDDAGTFALDPANVLPRRIAAWAERDPDRVLFTEVGGASLSYGETVERVRRWASWLRALGVGPGERVLSMLPASFDTYLLWMAASCVGACEHV